MLQSNKSGPVLKMQVNTEWKKTPNGGKKTSDRSNDDKRQPCGDAFYNARVHWQLCEQISNNYYCFTHSCGRLPSLNKQTRLHIRNHQWEGKYYIISVLPLKKKRKKTRTKQSALAACGRAALPQQWRVAAPPSLLFKAHSEYKFALIGKEKQLCRRRLCIIAIIISPCALLISRWEFCAA